MPVLPVGFDLQACPAERSDYRDNFRFFARMENMTGSPGTRCEEKGRDGGSKTRPVVFRGHRGRKRLGLGRETKCELSGVTHAHRTARSFNETEMHINRAFRKGITAGQWSVAGPAHRGERSCIAEGGANPRGKTGRENTGMTSGTAGDEDAVLEDGSAAGMVQYLGEHVDISDIGSAGNLQLVRCVA